MTLVLRLKNNIRNIDFCLSVWAGKFYIFMQFFTEKNVFTSLLFCVSLQSAENSVPHSQHKKRFSLT